MAIKMGMDDADDVVRRRGMVVDFGCAAQHDATRKTSEDNSKPGNFQAAGAIRLDILDSQILGYLPLHHCGDGGGGRSGGAGIGGGGVPCKLSRLLQKCRWQSGGGVIELLLTARVVLPLPLLLQWWWWLLLMVVGVDG